MTYHWAFRHGALASGMIATHMYGLAGNYTICLTLTDTDREEATALLAVVVSSDEETPVSSFAVSPSAGGAPPTGALNASASNDPNGTIVTFFWSLADGATATGVSPINTYAAEGSYTAMLTVTDDGLSDAITMVIAVIDGGQGGRQ